jgi:methyl-accepting chemotaxis protein
MDREAGSVNAAERAGYGDLDLLARRLSAIHPDVGEFAAYAMGEIDALRRRLAVIERATVRLEAAAAAAGEHIDRQAVLLREQAEQLATAHAQLTEIAAMCDLADWSSHAAGMPAPATVLADDLRSVVRKAPRAAISPHLP